MPTQIFFAVLFVDKGMTAPTHINAAGAHVFPGEVFPEPFVLMTGFGDQVVKRDVVFRAAELAIIIILMHLKPLITL